METVFFCKSKKIFFPARFIGCFLQHNYFYFIIFIQIIFIFLGALSPFQFAPAQSELQAEFFPHAETMSILILRRPITFHVPEIAKYSLAGLETKI